MPMLTLREMISNIEEAVSKRDIIYEHTPANSNILHEQLDNTFEAILTGRGEEKVLLPCTFSFIYLYRGQNEEYIPCKASIYRGAPKPEDVFIERMRMVQFERLLNSHPVVTGFYLKNNFVVDVEGLAQHYGLKTSVLDVTGNLDVAIFFAVCCYDPGTDSYHYYDDGHEHEAVMYVFDPLFDNEHTLVFMDNMFMRKNITPIGLQVFPRPGLQEGYALHLKKDESLKCWKYKFSFTCEDSKHYYDLIYKGKHIWEIDDIIVPKAKAIAMQNTFSYDVFRETFERYRPKGFSKTKLKKKLSDKVSISKDAKDLLFSEAERKDIKDKWNEHEGKEVAKSIIRRKVTEYGGEKTDVRGHTQFVDKLSESDYRSLERIRTVQYLRLIQAPDRPNCSEWVNYAETSRPAKTSRLINEKRKIPLSLESLFGERYLTREDWMLK